MSFWENVGKTTLIAGKKAVEATNNTLKESEEYKNKYLECHGEKLMEISQDTLEKAREVFLGKCKTIDTESLLDAFYGSERKLKKLDSAIPTTLKERWNDIVTMTNILKNYCQGNCKDLPWTTISTIAAALIYFVSPVDTIPDFIVGLGYVDDASIIALCMSMVQQDIENYKNHNNNEIPKQLMAEEEE